MPPETWQGAEASRSAVKRWQRRRQRRRRARNLSPRVPNFPVMRRNPRRKFANFQRARRGRRVTCGRARAHARAGRWLPPGRRACCCRLSRTPPAAAGGRERPGRGRHPRSALAFAPGERRGSARVHASSQLPPASAARWHRYLVPAAAPSDSSRSCRGGRRRCSGGGGGRFLCGRVSTQPPKLLTKFLAGPDTRRDQGHVFSRRPRPAAARP